MDKKYIDTAIVEKYHKILAVLSRSHPVNFSSVFSFFFLFKDSFSFVEGSKNPYPHGGPV